MIINVNIVRHPCDNWTAHKRIKDIPDIVDLKASFLSQGVHESRRIGKQEYMLRTRSVIFNMHLLKTEISERSASISGM
jgi:hypothetical protein